jgi:hypothetical protein
MMKSLIAAFIAREQFSDEFSRYLTILIRSVCVCECMFKKYPCQQKPIYWIIYNDEENKSTLSVVLLCIINYSEKQ